MLMSRKELRADVRPAALDHAVRGRRVVCRHPPARMLLRLFRLSARRCHQTIPRQIPMEGKTNAMVARRGRGVKGLLGRETPADGGGEAVGRLGGSRSRGRLRHIAGKMPALRGGARSRGRLRHMRAPVPDEAPSGAFPGASPVGGQVDSPPWPRKRHGGVPCRPERCPDFTSRLKREAARSKVAWRPPCHCGSRGATFSSG